MGTRSDGYHAVVRGGVPEVFEDLRKIGTLRRFRAGEHLIRQEGSDGGLVAVVSGLCKVTDVDTDGHEVLVAIRGPGDVFGEIAALTGGPRSNSVVALQAVRAAMVRVDDFDAYLDSSPQAGRRLATMLAHRVAETNRPAVAAHLKVEGRLADRILMLAQRFGRTHGDRIEVRSPLTHDDYSSWIGATRAVTTRAMGALRDRGLIDFGRGWIQVLDSDGLRELCLLDEWVPPPA